jgi:hypothetical protein
MISNNIEDAQAHFESWMEASDKASELVKFLEIPLEDYNYINKVDLYNIIMDDEKCKKLISKLKNKAFW